MNLFDFTQSNLDNETTVACCTLWGEKVYGTCGKGLICSGACFAQDAQLCPDCKVPLQFGRTGTIASSEVSLSSKGCASTASSACTNRCTRSGCRVKRQPWCCHVDKCRNKGLRYANICSWHEKYLGKFLNETYMIMMQLLQEMLAQHHGR